MTDDARDAPRPDAEPPTEAPTPRSLLLARLAVPIALAAIGYAVLVAQRWTVEHELQLVAPASVRPGDPIPLRAIVFDGIEDPDGGELVPARVDVELRAGDERVASTRLSPTPTRTAEGEIDAAPSTAGELLLVATARDDDGDVIATAERPLRVDPDAAPLPMTGRLGMPLQHLAAGPVIAEATDGAVPPLDVRIAGGTCVPDEPCELWIDAGDADAISIEEAPSVTVAQRSSRDGALIHLVVVPHGPDVAVTLIATRLGQPLARREVRLPIALATPWLSAPRVITREPLAMEAHAPPGRTALVVDAFEAGRWVHTGTLSPGAAELPFALGRPGLYLLQAHADPFGGDRAASRYVLLAPEGSGLSVDGARALLGAAGIQLTDPEGTDPRLLLAGAEEELRALPVAASGLEADRARLAARRHRLHVIAALALALGIAVFLITMLRRGLGAAAEAREVMREAGDPDATSSRNRTRMTIAVLALVGAVAVALLAGAALLLARAAMLPA